MTHAIDQIPIDMKPLNSFASPLLRESELFVRESVVVKIHVRPTGCAPAGPCQEPCVCVKTLVTRMHDPRR